jgi:hypothetical protein
MKRSFLTFVLLLLGAGTLHAQTQPRERELSNIEKFSAKSGTLIEKRFMDVGSVKSVKIRVLILTDLILNTRISGVRIEYEYSGRLGSDTKIAFLDPDEVVGLVKSIDVLKSKVFISAPDSYTEVQFNSRGGFEAGCYFGKGKWSTYLKLERFDSDSFVFLTPEDFDVLRDLLQQAKAKFSA